MSGRKSTPRCWRLRSLSARRSGSRSRALLGVAALGAVALLPLAAPLHASAATGAWTVFPSPVINNNNLNNQLSGVACTASNNCWAVGFAPKMTMMVGVQPLIEHYDGTMWSETVGPDVSAPLNSVFGQLFAVTCVNAGDCWAVGQQGTGTGGTGTQQTLAVHYDGTSWTLQMSDNTSTSQVNQLNAVTCTATNNCWAVGYAENGTGSNAPRQTLAELYNGIAWVVKPTPTTPSTTGNASLTGVACWISNGCLAVGFAGTASALADRWDGTLWSAITPPTTTQPTATWLQGVTCPANIGCWAAGYMPFAALETVVAHYDGSAWTVPMSPDSGTSSNRLLAVACADVTHCWAVGWYQGTSAQNTLALEYDGTSWTVDSSDNVGGGFNNLLQGVTCVSTTDCWAVGYDDPSSGVSTSRALIEHFAPLTVTTPEVPWPALAIAIGLVAAVTVGRRRTGAD